jgi:dihydrofolate reductase/thymidylate synthase
MSFNLIVAYDKETRGIGYKQQIPWGYIKEDMEHFKNMTTGNTVIMGSNTYKSLPNSSPLKNRYNIVIGNNVSIKHKNTSSYNTFRRDDDQNIQKALNFDNALRLGLNKNKEIFIIGGSMVYNEALNSPLCKYVYVTEILTQDLKFDRYFPPLPKYFKEISSRESISMGNKMVFKVFENVLDLGSQEMEYLNLLTNILEKGNIRSDRTDTGTISIFGPQIKFSIRDNVLPLITTKKTFFRGIIEELLFFLRGDHDNRILIEKGINIWTKNTSKEYIEKYGKKLEEHDLGKAYPVQWRAAGAPLQKLEDSYIGKGIDQISQIIHLLKTDPYSRRIILNAWNVTDLEDMILVPCHVMYQFYVTDIGEDKYLSCMMIQRSADTFLGLPFNIASVATLTNILAKTCNMKPNEIIINIGDAHIYKNHIEQVKTQLKRFPYKFPTMKINKELNDISDIEKLKYTDFELRDYLYWDPIKADMAV